MDAFFASVEQRDDPSLRGKPIAVGGVDRGVVAAASYEARKFGVRSAMPAKTALGLCPQLIFVRHRFEVYQSVSRQIKAIFESYTDGVEPLSLDEAYLDVTHNKKGMLSATLIAREIKQRIKTETGLTASAGISVNKFLAKIASDIDKPDGLYLIPPQKVVSFIANLDIDRFHGIGKVTAAKMKKMGIFTGADLRAVEKNVLTKQFGKAGSWYYDMARGIDHRKVSPGRARKSVSAENTYANDLYTRKEINASLEKLTETVARRLEKTGLAGRTVTLKIRFRDFRQTTRSRTVSDYLSGYNDLWPVVKALIDQPAVSGHGIRLLGVGVSGLNNRKQAIPEVGKQLTFPF